MTRAGGLTLGIAVSLFAVAALAATANESKEAEYVVSVDGLKLRAEGADTEVIAELAAGTRVVNLSAEAYGDRFGTSWREVRVGDNTGWVIDRYVVPAAEYDALAKAGELAKLNEYYIVYVAKLDLRAQPSLDGEALAALEAGTRIANANAEVAGVENAFWRKVRAGDKVGWVADRYILPEGLYNAFRRADELGKTGDAEGMVAAVSEGGLEVGFDKFCFEISPDRRKIFVIPSWGWGLEDIPQWGGGYPPGGRVGTGFPVLYFVAGRGLVEYFRAYKDIRGIWSRDSEYYAYLEKGIYEYAYHMPLMLLDVGRWRRTRVGDSVYIYESGYKYEFAGPYLLWMGEEPVKEPGPPPLERESYTPVLWAYDIAAGKALRLLAADLTTVKKRPVNGPIGEGVAYYEVKMRPVGPCPAAVADSELYQKYNGGFAYAADRAFW